MKENTPKKHLDWVSTCTDSLDSQVAAENNLNACYEPLESPMAGGGDIGAGDALTHVAESPFKVMGFLEFGCMEASRKE